MSMSQIQKLLSERNLDLQQMSKQTGLRTESIQSFEDRVQEIFIELEKISDALDMSPPNVLGAALEKKSLPKKGIPEWFCDAFPDAPPCRQ